MEQAARVESRAMQDAGYVGKPMRRRAHGDPSNPTNPALGLVRILKGAYPKLPPWPHAGRSKGLALDIGCGDGSNTEFMVREGWTCFGLEIEPSHVAKLAQRGQARYAVGVCESLPFADGTFNLIVGWHSVYYMSTHVDSLTQHMSEIARVLSLQGTAVLSVPMPTNFIFDGAATTLGPPGESMAGIDYAMLGDDPFGYRKGMTFARVIDIEAWCESLLNNYGLHAAVGEEMGDWFGLRYDWWDVVLRRG